MKRKNKGNEINYLDLIPVRNDKLKWNISDDGEVTIFKENTGLFNRIAQKTAGRPEVSQIHLEEFGSFIWGKMDGKNTVDDIAGLLSEKFGEKAEPLYDRLVQYSHMLESYDFICMKKEPDRSF